MRQFLASSLAVVLAVIASHGSAAFGQAPSAAPRFTRHVVPLLSKLGCNGGGCHGMVQGKGGLRLSLFGADPASDQLHLVREFAGRRVNLQNPDDSLMLKKATARVPHEGGRRVAPDDPDFAVLRAWIASGAPLDDVAAAQVVRFEVTPAQRTAHPGEKFALKVEATFADGTTEDVTSSCAFESLATETAEVDARGTVRAVDVGDTTLVVRRPGQVAWCTLIVAPEKPATDFPVVAEHGFVDKHVVERLRLLGIPPAETCDDATFLRRAVLDATGRLPEPDEIRAFLASTDPDKRTKAVDDLLKRPGHAALWATKFMDVLRVTGFNQATFPPLVQEEYRAYSWLRARFEENLPYDELVARILLATSREGLDDAKWAEQSAAVVREEVEGRLPEAYRSRRTLDLFWQRRMATDVDHAIRVGHAFLGLRLQCAQCHRHPNDVWTQADLLDFANFFMRVPHFSSIGNPRRKVDKDVESLRKATSGLVPQKARGAWEKSFGEREILLLTSADIAGDGMKGGRSFFNTSKDGFATVTSPLGTQSSHVLRFVGDDRPVPDPGDETDRRALVVAWLRRPDNPFFARAIVNRVWSHYFDRGIVDPPDDLSPLNPPSHPALLQELCEDFVSHGYDLRRLHRTLLTSRTYQQASRTTEANRGHRRLFAAFAVRRLPAEVVLDAVDQAVGVRTDWSKFREARGAMPPGLALLDGASLFLRGDGEGSFALTTFGRPGRDVEVVCDCERENRSTMLQALYLANHPQVRKNLAGANGRVAAVLAKTDDETVRIEEIFLATVSRLPSEAERLLAHEYLAGAASPKAGLEGLLWSLINAHEFQFNQ